MADEEGSETRTSLERINKVCKGISIVLKIVFFVICIFWLFSAFSLILSFVNSLGTGEASVSGIVPVFLHIARGIIIVTLFVALMSLFSEAAKGESPFTLKQAKRLRMTAYILVVYGILEVLLSANAAVLYYEGINSGFVSADSSAIIAVNFAPFIAAAVVFAFSFVFQYGVLLQEFSDETL